jgi:hypothetical protein
LLDVSQTCALLWHSLKPIDPVELEQCIQSITGKISHEVAEQHCRVFNAIFLFYNERTRHLSL